MPIEMDGLMGDSPAHLAIEALVEAVIDWTEDRQSRDDAERALLIAAQPYLEKRTA